MDSLDKLKDKIIYRLINTERNLEYLKNVPSIQWNDLSIVFSVFLKETETFVDIDDAALREWKISEDYLYEIAKSNTPQIMPLSSESLPVFLKSNYEIENTSDMIYPFMYILFNQYMRFGANAMLNEKIFQSISIDKKCDLVIIPSSIHEVIVIPYVEGLDFKELSDFIKETNKTVLEPQDILADHAYLYSMFLNRIVCLEELDNIEILIAHKPGENNECIS